MPTRARIFAEIISNLPSNPASQTEEDQSWWHLPHPLRSGNKHHHSPQKLDCDFTTGSHWQVLLTFQILPRPLTQPLLTTALLRMNELSARNDLRVWLCHMNRDVGETWPHGCCSQPWQKGERNREFLGPEHSNLESQRTSTVGNLEIAEMRGDLGSTSSWPLLCYVIPFFP